MISIDLDTLELPNSYEINRYLESCAVLFPIFRGLVELVKLTVNDPDLTDCEDPIHLTNFMGSRDLGGSIDINYKSVCMFIEWNRLHTEHSTYSRNTYPSNSSVIESMVLDAIEERIFSITLPSNRNSSILFALNNKYRNPGEVLVDFLDYDSNLDLQLVTYSFGSEGISLSEDPDDVDEKEINKAKHYAKLIGQLLHPYFEQPTMRNDGSTPFSLN